MLQAMGTAAPLTCAVLPPSGDARGDGRCRAGARCAATRGLMTELSAMRGLFGQTIRVNSASYAATDASARRSIFVTTLTLVLLWLFR